jgi:hypothetical protein
VVPSYQHETVTVRNRTCPRQRRVDGAKRPSDDGARRCPRRIHGTDRTKRMSFKAIIELNEAYEPSGPGGKEPAGRASSLGIRAREYHFALRVREVTCFVHLSTASRFLPHRS